LNDLLSYSHSLRSGLFSDAPPALENQTRCLSISALVNESILGRFDLMSGSFTRKFFHAFVFTFSSLNFISISSRAPWNFFRFARIFRGARAVKGKLDSHVRSETVFLPAADAAGDGLKGLIAQPFFAVARVVAIALLVLTQESRHAQRAKRIGQRLATGGSQFNGIEPVRFHPLFLV
jgi:hypothetical protein